MKFIDLKYQDHVAVATFNRTTNTINAQLVVDLEELVQTARKKSAAIGLVVTGGSEKFFSMGFDLPEIFPLSREEFTVFFKRFNRLCLDLFTLSKPTMAAIPGHAVAGGNILALCFDYRFIAAGHKLMGLNEIKLGVPLPYVCDCMLRNQIGYRHARTVADSGDFFKPPQLLEMGMIDRILKPHRLLPEAVRHVRRIGETSLPAFTMIKRNRVEKVVAEIAEQLEAREEIFVDSWYSDETRKRLQQAMEKF